MQRSRQNRRNEGQEWSRKEPFIGSFPKEIKHFWAGARQMGPPNQKPPYSNKVETLWVRERGQSQITECVLVSGRMAPVFEPEASLPRIEQAPSGSFPWLTLRQSCSQNLKSHYFDFTTVEAEIGKKQISLQFEPELVIGSKLPGSSPGSWSFLSKFLFWHQGLRLYPHQLPGDVFNSLGLHLHC